MRTRYTSTRGAVAPKGSNRYAILFRIQTAKKPETREKRIREFIQRLEKEEKIFP